MNGGSASSSASSSDVLLVTKQEVPLWKLGLVALPSMTITMVWTVLMPNAAHFMTRLGMDPAWVRFNNLAGPICGLLTQPIVGAISDSLTSPRGRRRPVIVTGLALTLVAGTLFSSSERLLPAGQASILAAVMFWILNVSINVYTMPVRALVADLATLSHQQPAQTIDVAYQAFGALLASSVVSSYPDASEHLFELVPMGIALNCAAVAVQCFLAEERPQVHVEDAGVCQAVRDSSSFLGPLCGVHFLAWIGLSTWTMYISQWFITCVDEGDAASPAGLPGEHHPGLCQQRFAYGNQSKAGFLLMASMAAFYLFERRWVRPKYFYAHCLVMGAIVSLCASAIPEHDGSRLAVWCMTFSALPQVGAASVPFGLIGERSARAEQLGPPEGGPPAGTALQMGLLNCALTIGQKVTIAMLAVLEAQMSAARALTVAFVVAAVALFMGGVGALFLSDGAADDAERPEDYEPREPRPLQLETAKWGGGLL